MECSITVNKNYLSPVSKDIFGWVIGKNSIKMVSLGPVEAASQKGFSPLIAGLEC